MKKDIQEVIEIPEGVKVEIEGGRIRISKGDAVLEKKLEYTGRVDGNKIILEKEKASKKDKKLIKSTFAHITNLLSGLDKKYTYKLQICSVHFPMNVSVKENELIIKNFLGEVKERKAKILAGVNVKIDKEVIIIESNDKEKAGQTAANMEKATRICNRDKRVFQDGIYIIEKEKGVRQKK